MTGGGGGKDLEDFLELLEITGVVVLLVEVVPPDEDFLEDFLLCDDRALPHLHSSSSFTFFFSDFFFFFFFLLFPLLLRFGNWAL